MSTNDYTDDYMGWYELEDVYKHGELVGTILSVCVEWSDEDGDEQEDCESELMPKGWDGADPAEYESLERIVCERNGFEFDPDKFDLRGGAR